MIGMARNLREELKTLQEATNAQEGMFLTLEGDTRQLRVYPSYDAYINSETAVYRISKYVQGQWVDREQFIIWSQAFVDEKAGQA